MLGLQVACLAWTLGSPTPSRSPRSSCSPRPPPSRWSRALIAPSSCSRASSPRRPPGLSTISSRGWGAFVYLIIFGSLVGFTAFAYCLNELPATTVGTYAYVNPVVAVFLGWLILGESLYARPARRRCADRAVGGADDAQKR